MTTKEINQAPARNVEDEPVKRTSQHKIIIANLHKTLQGSG